LPAAESLWQGCRRADDRSSTIHGRDDRWVCGRRIYNQFADLSFDFPYGPTPVSVSVSTMFVATRGVGGDFFVWLLIVWAGESFRSWTFYDQKSDRLGS
jgi:hypothetical protein